MILFDVVLPDIENRADATESYDFGRNRSTTPNRAEADNRSTPLCRRRS